ncbi:MAG TPA: nucleotidyl transferase AbiEii/AbiGii toxin family protein, partial [Bacteroidales bacterium]|nr:nucleotidyl transferase AbiEii/AbiGii toxin family protein [Bacteroidales bacterium]
DSHALVDFQTRNVPLPDVHELAAGKLAAMLARGQARDLFDCYQILTMKGIDRERLRLAFVVYGGMNRKDWRTVSIADLDFDPDELTRLLIPTLNRRVVEKQGSPAEYGERLIRECQSKLKAVLPFNDPERKFLDLLLEKGEIDASLLTPDEALQKRIQSQPLLQWKALNVKRHKELA